MSKKSSQIASENMSMKFSKGWGIILYQALMFFFLIGFSIDGLNIVAPAFAESTGIAYDQVLGVATWAGMIGVVAYILIARINVSVGPRLLSGVCLIGAGLSYIFLGHSTTLTTYFIALTLVTCFINGAAYIAGNTLIAQWFPKKKGLANGFTTMGHNSSLHQDRCSMRNRVCSFCFNVRYFRSKPGSSRLRMPSSMSWEAAPPIVKKVRPASSNTCPRIRWSTWGRMGRTLPPCQFSIGYFTRAS